MFSRQLRPLHVAALAWLFGATLWGCGSVYHNARASLNPDPAQRAALRTAAAGEEELAVRRAAADLRVILRAPHWRERREDAADVLLLRAFELERAALSVTDVAGADGSEATRQIDLARAVRVAAEVCHEGPADRALAALDEVLPEAGAASVSR